MLLPPPIPPALLEAAVLLERSVSPMLLPLNTLASGDCLPPCFICSCVNWESATNADDGNREEFKDEFEEVDAAASASAAAEVIAKVDTESSDCVLLAVAAAPPLPAPAPPPPPPPTTVLFELFFQNDFLLEGPAEPFGTC
uniref:Uncharacterized protein n=1 Tax=Glossina austeni TaxID=7395 RepID=A0A1A9VU91_GLOAU